MTAQTEQRPAASTRRPLPTVLVVGGLLVFAGLLSWVLYALSTGHERHSFTRGGDPAAYVDLVAGRTYHLAIPGGSQTEQSLGLDPTKLRCTAAESGQPPATLSVAAESNPKAINRIGSFTAGRSGSFRISCTGIGPVYVDDAEDAGFDWSGLWLVLASVMLAVGLPLTLTGMRCSPRA